MSFLLPKAGEIIKYTLNRLSEDINKRDKNEWVSFKLYESMPFNTNTTYQEFVDTIKASPQFKISQDGEHFRVDHNNSGCAKFNDPNLNPGINFNFNFASDTKPIDNPNVGNLTPPTMFGIKPPDNNNEGGFKFGDWQANANNNTNNNTFTFGNTNNSNAFNFGSSTDNNKANTNNTNNSSTIKEQKQDPILTMYARKQQTEWECDQCLLNNNYTAIKCIACENPNPLMAGNTTGANSTFTFGQTNNSNLFNFDFTNKDNKNNNSSFHNPFNLTNSAISTTTNTSNNIFASPITTSEVKSDPGKKYCNPPEYSLSNQLAKFLIQKQPKDLTVIIKYNKNNKKPSNTNTVISSPGGPIINDFVIVNNDDDKNINSDNNTETKYDDNKSTVEPVIIKTNKLILACHSPVFESLIFSQIDNNTDQTDNTSMHTEIVSNTNDNESKVNSANLNRSIGLNTIEINDIPADLFNLLLGYFINDSILLNDNNSEVLLEISHNYQIESLTKLCESYIKTSINNGNVFDKYIIAKKNNSKFVNVLLQHIMDDASFCIRDNKFLQLDPIDVYNISKSESLNCKEVELFNNIIVWSIAELGRQNKDINVNNQINLLTNKDYNILDNIRFPLFTTTELATHVSPLNIIPQQHLIQLFTYVSLTQDIRQTIPYNLPYPNKQRATVVYSPTVTGIVASVTTPYRTTSEKIPAGWGSPATNIYYQSISIMPEYATISHEELRIAQTK